MDWLRSKATCTLSESWLSSTRNQTLLSMFPFHNMNRTWRVRHIDAKLSKPNTIPIPILIKSNPHQYSFLPSPGRWTTPAVNPAPRYDARHGRKAPITDSVASPLPYLACQLPGHGAQPFVANSHSLLPAHVACTCATCATFNSVQFDSRSIHAHILNPTQFRGPTQAPLGPGRLHFDGVHAA